MTDPVKGPGGRPTTFSDEIGAVLCARIADGESLRSICAEEEMPDKATVFRWLAVPELSEFRDQYARAREQQADALFDEILEIADDARNDWMERRGEEDAGWVANGEHIQRSKLRIDARKWMAGKLRPKVYGDKSVIEGPGENGEHLVQNTVADDLRTALDAIAGKIASGDKPG